MSVRRRTPQSSFYDASFLVEALFPPGNPYRLFREKIHPVLERARPSLEALYCASNGRPGLDPVFLAEVTALQFLEKAPDRQAAANVEVHLGWKYGLRMRVDEKGFDASTLCVFRERLVKAGLADVVFQAMLGELESVGLVKRRRQRIDSTHVLGCVSDMSRLECVRETARLWLEAMEQAAPNAPRPDGWAAWQERYCRLSVDWPRQTREQMHAQLRQAGGDLQAMLAWLEGDGKAWRDGAESGLLRRVFGEQFEIAPEGAQARKVTASGTVVNPHDPEAQWSVKDHGKKTAWTGYKAHVGETAPEEGLTVAPGAPTEQFITHLETTGAIASDLQGYEAFVEAQLQADPDALRTTYADSAYLSGETLARAQAQGRELIGPPRPAPATGEQSAEAFDVNVAERTALCPAGQRSSQCSRIDDAHQGRVHYRFEWAPSARRATAAAPARRARPDDGPSVWASITTCSRPGAGPSRGRSFAGACARARRLKGRSAN